MTKEYIKLNNTSLINKEYKQINNKLSKTNPLTSFLKLNALAIGLLQDPNKHPTNYVFSRMHQALEV